MTLPLCPEAQEWVNSRTPHQKAAMHWQVLVRSMPWDFQNDERKRVFVEYCTEDLGMDEEAANDIMRWSP